MFGSSAAPVQLLIVRLVLSELRAGRVGRTERVGGWVTRHAVRLFLSLRVVERGRTEGVRIVVVEVVGVRLDGVGVVVAEQGTRVPRTQSCWCCCC